MNIECYYKGQRATYQGVDMSKRMYKVRTADGKMHYPELLSQIDFRSHSQQQDLFNMNQCANS